jgi:PAS domain S-box-containing protein
MDYEVLHSFLNALNESAYLIDTQGNVLVANDEFARRLGIDVRDVHGANIYDVLPEEIIEMRRERVSEAVSEKQPVVFEEVRDGRTFLNSVKPVTDSSGNVQSLAFVGVEITERKAMEEALTLANIELEGFAHVVSHDLRGPVSAAYAGSELLKRLIEMPSSVEKRSEIMEIAAIISRNVEKASVLIDELLNLAKARQAPIDVAGVDITELVEEILDERNKEIRTRGISVDIPGDLGRVRANSTQMYQLFSNIIGNSISHNDKADLVIEIYYLGKDEQDGHLYLIRDNGRGLPEDTMDRIFLPFHVGETGEWGIGLSVVDRIVKAYGGHIRAYNDDGACFEFNIKDAPMDSLKAKHVAIRG